MNNSSVVIKDLKDYQFTYYRDAKGLRVFDKIKGESIVFDKVRTLSLIRFSLRFLNSLTMKSRKSK